MKHIAILASLLFLLPGCVAVVAGAGAAGYLAYRDSNNDPLEEIVGQEQEIVVEATIETLETLRDVGTSVTNDRGAVAVREGTTALKPRLFRAQIDDTEVTVIVEAYDFDVVTGLGQSLVRVETQMKLSGDQNLLSRQILDEVHERSESLAKRHR